MKNPHYIIENVFVPIKRVKETFLYYALVNFDFDQKATSLYYRN